jgi:cytochrome c553
MCIEKLIRDAVGMLLACCLLSAAHTAPFENTIAQRAQACTGCHGPQGRAAPDGYYPRLAGKPAGYLYQQLLNFRDGRRHYGLMTQLVEPLSDAYLLELAQHFAALDVPYPPPAPVQASVDALRRGEQLALRGDTARKLPACAQCHGASLTGVQPNVPGLLGLPRDYLNAQLGAWVTGQRRAHAPDCMGQIARQLRADDVSAVSAWLATQPVAKNAKPADSLPQPLPMDCGRPQTPAPSPTPSTLATLATQGAYLARAGNCMHCHTTPGGVPYSGGRAIQTPFGTVYSSNLTPDPTTGLGRWRADDFWQALHHGQGKDGRALVPAFPYTSYTQISRSDADALHAYLQSLPPTVRINTPHALRWPFGTPWALSAFKAIYMRSGSYENDSKQSAAWNRGAYLVRGLGHCAECHSPRSPLGGIANPMALTGARLQNSYAPSLLQADEAGVAHWPLADIVQLLKTGQTPYAMATGPMAQVVQHSTQHLSNADLQAMATYLKALPTAPPTPQKTASPNTSANASVSPRGPALYDKHCASCHGAQGQGIPSAYPALAGNRAVTSAHISNLVQTVRYGGFGPTTLAHPRPYGMPPYLIELTDADIAAVLTHLRTQWGNQASPVTPLQVLQQRNK